MLNSEKEIFELLDLSYIPPELREGLGEIGIAAKLHKIGESWPDLVNQHDIKGIIHAHTTYSDGTATLRQMAEAAIAKGYQYLGITDHSQSAAYAGGLKYSDIIRQHNEIDLLNREFHPFKIFKGIESDILADGSLDYPIDVLELFDFVIASLHSHFQMGKEEMMWRLERAIANPYTTILGHPTTRLLLKRGPVELDINRVLQFAADNQVAVELNSNPMRLDLDWRYHSYARELGVLVPICPDAHSIEGMNDIFYGVGIARKGGLTSKCVPNTWNMEQIADFFQRRKR